MGFISNIFNFIKSKVPQKPVETSPVQVTPTIVQPPVDPIAWRFKVRENGIKILKNAWNSQRDNKFSPASACNITALQVAMSLDYAELKDDDLFLIANSEETKQTVMKKYPGNDWILNYYKIGSANEVFVVICEAANKVMGSSAYCKMVYDQTIDQIKAQIDMGYCVMLCGRFVGGGHFITVVGYNDQTKSFIVNDSWGNWMTKYQNRNGDNVEYPYEVTRKTMGRISIFVHSDKRIPV